MDFKNRKIFFIYSLVFILGIFLRLYNIDRPILWHDEICTTLRVQYPFFQTIQYLRHSPFPPLYYILMKLWVTVFGNSEFVIRFPSAIFSILSIIYIFKLSKELFNEKVGILSAFLFSISPYSINYAQEAKMYAMLWFLETVSFLLFYRFMIKGGARTLLFYIIFTTLSIYTMYTGFIFMLIQNTIFFLFLDREKRKRWLMGQVIIMLLYYPWMKSFVFAVTHRPGIKWIHNTDNYFKFFIETFMLTTGSSIGKIIFADLYLYVFLIFSVVSEIILIRNRKHQFSKLIMNYYLLFTWIIVPFILYCMFDHFISPVLQTRYLGFIHIPLIILLSKGINNLNIKIKNTVLVFLITVIFSCHLYPYYQKNLKIDGEDFREFIHQLRKRVRNSDLVISNFSPNTIGYYYKNSKIEIGDLDKIDIDKEYNFIFILYKGRKPPKGEVKGYKLEEEYSVGGGRLGLLKFKKLQ